MGCFAPFLLAKGRVRGWNEQSYTLVCGIGSVPLHPEALPASMAGQPGVALAHQHGTYHRRMTVRECCRIQTFPDDFTFGDASLSLVHDVIGNAIPPVLMERIAVAVRNDLVLAGVVSPAASAPIQLGA